MIRLIYLDLDGVLADFEGTALDLFGPTWKEEIEKSNWGKFTQYPNLYQLLRAMPYALELYETCLSIADTQVLTALPNRARSSFPNAAQHKIEWVRKHISPDLRVHFGPFAQDKQYHCYSPQDILIDDVERNIQQWPGIGIHHLDIRTTLYQLKML